MAETQEQTTTTQTDTEEKKGGGILLPATAGAAGIVGGAVAATSFIDEKKLGIKIKAAENKAGDAFRKYKEAKVKATEALTNHATDGANNIKLKGAYEAAIAPHVEAVKKYRTFRDEAVKAFDTLSAEKQGKIKLARTEGELNHLKSLEKSSSRNYLIKAHETLLNAYKETVEKSDFNKLTPEDAVKKLAEAEKTAQEKVETFAVPAGLEFPEAEIEKMRHAGLQQAAKVEPEIVNPILQATQSHFDTLTASIAEHDKAKKDWITEKLEPATKAESTTLKSADKKYAQLCNTEAIVVKNKDSFTGAFKRAYQLAKEGTSQMKLAILASSVALGVASYAGVRALTAKKKPESYTEQVDQSRAAPDPTQAAARA